MDQVVSGILGSVRRLSRIFEGKKSQIFVTNYPGFSLKTLAVALLLIFSTSTIRAQNPEDVHATGSNLLRVGSGTTNPTGTEQDKRYFEEIANARIFFQYFSVGLRYEMDDPSEVGRSFQGLRRRWILYKKDQITLQAGDVNALFGRGLGVNLFESRPLNYDSWLDGLYAASDYKIPKDWVDADMTLGIKGVGGKTDFYPIDSTQPPMHISARAIEAEIGLFRKKVIFGAGFLEANTGVSIIGLFNRTLNTQRNVNQPELYFDINTGEFEAFAEWTENRNHVTQYLGSTVDTSNTGHAVYASLSYAGPSVGLTFEYKNYSYFHRPSNSAYNNIFSKLPISSPPEVYKEFTYTTITRTTHAVNFDDEVGYQLEANITAIPRVTINLEGAASSAHNKYDNASTSVDSTSLLPRLTDLGFYPFWEIFAETEWEFNPENDLDYVKFAFHRRSDVIVYNATNPGGSDYRWTTTLAAKTQIETTPNQSFLGIFEHQWEYDAARTTPDKRYMNELITLQYSFNPTLTFGALFDLAVQYENMPYHLEDHWTQGFVSLRLGQSHNLLMSYGSERGGLNCTGGICRVVPPFSGLRVTLTSQI